MKDLAFLEEGHKYFNQNKLINIHKIIVAGKIIKNIKESQIFIYDYKPVYSLSFLSDPQPLEDKDLTVLSELLEPKFKLNTKKSRMKRKTNTESKLEETETKLSNLFLDYIKDYGLTLCNKMSLKDRIKQFKINYTCISLLENSNPVHRNLASERTFSTSSILSSI